MPRNYLLPNLRMGLNSVVDSHFMEACSSSIISHDVDIFGMSVCSG